jgi:hypothetical protein
MYRQESFMASPHLPELLRFYITLPERRAAKANWKPLFM